jgi:hypothetical protein
LKYLSLAALAGTIVLPQCFGQAPVPPPPARSPKINFSAPAADHVVEFTPDKVRSSVNPVRLTFRGWLYTPEGLSFISPDVAKYPAEERRLLEAIAAARKGGIVAVVPYWAPAEQATVRKTVTQPSVSEGMTSFLRSVENSVILAKILYGPYSVMLVQHIGESLPSAQAPARYVMKKVGDEFYLTDELAADPVFVYMAEKYVRQLVAQITGQQL